MTHQCPLCGMELKLWINEDPLSIEKSAGVFNYGCLQCCLMLHGWCSCNMPEKEREAFAEALYPAWLDSIDRSEIVRTMKAENVLRAAYGMKEVKVGDIAYRDLERRLAAMKEEE